MIRQVRAKRGITLLLTVTVLMLLSTAIIAFARNTISERKSTHNHLGKIKAKLVSFAGIEAAMTYLRETMRMQNYITLDDLWPRDVMESLEDIYLQTAHNSDPQIFRQQGVVTAGAETYYYSGITEQTSQPLVYLYAFTIAVLR